MRSCSQEYARHSCRLQRTQEVLTQILHANCGEPQIPAELPYYVRKGQKAGQDAEECRHKPTEPKTADHSQVSHESEFPVRVARWGRLRFRPQEWLTSPGRLKRHRRHK